MKTIQEIISGNKLILHLIFSLAVLIGLAAGVYLMHLQGYRFENYWSTATDCLFFLLYIYTGRWLFAQWYFRRDLARFIIATLLANFLLLILKWLAVRHIFHHPFAGLWELGIDVMPFFLVGLIIGMLLKLVRVMVEKELLDAQIKVEQKQSEFNILQAQLSPHFLFNVLNNLYGISIEEHERVPSLILKLSNLLRYSVYSAKKPFVLLTDELNYIQNYIDFEQIRISDRLVLQTNIEPIAEPSVKIAPMVLIVFVENAFKHAKNSLIRQIHISITLQIKENFIFFTVTNSYHNEDQKEHIPDEGSGFGLANTIRRLDLLYGNEYKLKQEAVNDSYIVQLQVTIKH